MTDKATPAKVRLTDVLGPTLPKRDKVEALMKRCQIGVGGRRALDDAHDIMAECYGTLGALMLAVETLHAETVALRAMYEEADAESDALAREAHTWSKAAEHYAKQQLARESQAEDLYGRLHSLSKAMESSGRIDEHEYPDAYGTILDAMKYVQPEAERPEAQPGAPTFDGADAWNAYGA